jgi:RimJ/RimL family protein N-acetyltransferase
MDLAYPAVVPADADSLARFVSAHEWPYHGTPRPSLAEAARRAPSWWARDVDGRWVERDGERIGLLRIFDLGDPTAILDLRIVPPERGRGIGTAAVRWAAAHVFTTYPAVLRLEGHTRIDNRVMRRVFEKCGFALEAHHRRAWYTDGEPPRDSIGYALLREDWTSGRTTPVAWDRGPA